MGKLVDVLGGTGCCRSPPVRASFKCLIAGWKPWGKQFTSAGCLYSRALIERIRAAGVPAIHFGTGAAGFFRELHAAGGDVMGVDWRINIDQAWLDISCRSVWAAGSQRC